MKAKDLKKLIGQGFLPVIEFIGDDSLYKMDLPPKTEWYLDELEEKSDGTKSYLRFQFYSLLDEPPKNRKWIKKLLDSYHILEYKWDGKWEDEVPFLKVVRRECLEINKFNFIVTIRRENKINRFLVVSTDCDSIPFILDDYGEIVDIQPVKSSIFLLKN